MNVLVLWMLLGLVDVAIHVAMYLHDGPSPKMQAFAVAHGERLMWELVVFCLLLTVLLGPIALAITAAEHFRRERT